MAEARYFVQAMQMLDDIIESEGVEIEGKQYALVKDRIFVFRQMFGGEYGIDTGIEWLETDDTPMCLVKAEISDLTDRVVASGHSTGWPGKTVDIEAYVEMAETRAIGRALAVFGLGGEAIASADEMVAKTRRENVVKMVKPVDKTPAEPVDMSVLLDKIKEAGDVVVLTAIWVDIGNEPSATRSKGEKSELRAAFNARLSELKEGEG